MRATRSRPDFLLLLSEASALLPVSPIKLPDTGQSEVWKKQKSIPMKRKQSSKEAKVRLRDGSAFKPKTQR